jgi:hypothetical protein
MSVILTILMMLADFNPPQTILVTIDGTMWQDIYNGTDAARYSGPPLKGEELVPNLYSSFVNQGMAIGKESPMIASGPNHVSLPGYLEITRGHPSVDCQSNLCKPKIDNSIFYLFNSSAVFSFWFGVGKTIPQGTNTYADIAINHRLDLVAENRAISYLSVNSPQFVWIALGNTDEWGHLNNYPEYIKALRAADQFVGMLVKKYPNSNIIVTCDHGRNKNFRDHGLGTDSERVWLMMRGPTIPALGFVKYSERKSLSNILPTIKELTTGIHDPDSLL